VNRLPTPSVLSASIARSATEGPLNNPGCENVIVAVSAATEHDETRNPASGAPLADIEALYRAEYGRFVAVAAMLCGDTESGRDAVQEGFARAIQSRSSYRGHGALEGWVWRIVVNAAHSVARQSRPASIRVVPERAGAAPVEGPEYALLAALPLRQRTVLFLRYYADLDYRAIADVLEVEVGTVGSTLNAALAALRRGMARKVAE
jgi:RNA polymerase sigma-70 factor, ECF subfamily